VYIKQLGAVTIPGDGQRGNKTGGQGNTSGKANIKCKCEQHLPTGLQCALLHNASNSIGTFMLPVSGQALDHLEGYSTSP
jgi:hypothetical protein